MIETRRSRLAGMALLVAASALTASCASPSARIAHELGRYGLSEGPARCMGDRLQSNLSVGQLQQLGRVAQSVQQTRGQRLTASDLIRAGTRIDDVKIPLEVTKAAASCGALSEAVGVQGG